MCDVCILRIKHNEEIAEMVYKNAGNNSDDALYDLYRHNLAYDHSKEMYLLKKYAPDRYEEKKQQQMKMISDAIERLKK